MICMYEISFYCIEINVRDEIESEYLSIIFLSIYWRLRECQYFPKHTEEHHTLNDFKNAKK